MIQEMLISFLLRPLGKLMDHFSEKTKERTFVFFSLLLFLIYFVYNTSWFSFASYFPAFVAGCLCLGMMILSMLHSGIKPISFSPVLFSLWMLVGILIAVASLRFNTDWLSDALIYLLVCPVVFIAWGNAEYKRIFRLMIQATIISFIFFFCVSAFFFPLGEDQYQSFFSNPNAVSGYLALVFACLLTYTFRNNGYSWSWIAIQILLGLCSGMIYFTHSRSGQLAAICTFVFSSVLYVFMKKTAVWRRFFYRVLPIILVILILIPVTFYFMQICNRSVDMIIGNECKPFIHFGAVQETSESRYSVSGKNLNRITTGRIDIWKAFLERVTMWGTGEEPSFYIESMNRTYGNPHMTPLLFAYQYGWLCAVISLLFNILAGFKSIYFVKKNKEDSLALFPFAITITYGVIFMVETINTPFLYMITMFYYFIQTPLIRVFSLESDT